jgi:hypothetical protein
MRKLFQPVALVAETLVGRLEKIFAFFTARNLWEGSKAIGERRLSL